jgi:uncharacterized protein involved in exopolysaccharide biosynthesis
MDSLDKDILTSENEVDLMELAKKLWENRKFILKVCGIGIVIGLIVAFSIPKEYTTTVILAPEAEAAGKGNIGALAAVAGINLQQNAGQELSPELYPNIVSSTPFLIGLFDVQVRDQKENIDTSLYTYLDEKQRKAWWSYVLGAPFKLLELVSSKEKNAVPNPDFPMIMLSKDQEDILKNLKERINVSVDKKTGVITLSSQMQSPVISAFIADTITSYMQSYIINYRTQKARQDLLFTQKLYDEAKADYYKAQQNLATYADENLAIVSARFRTTQERLQNEMSLAYGVYNQMAQQLQMAKIKVQDITPVYTVIQPAVVPLKATSPKKMIILVGFTFLAFAGTCGWIVLKDRFSIVGKDMFSAK